MLQAYPKLPIRRCCIMFQQYRFKYKKKWVCIVRLKNDIMQSYTLLSPTSLAFYHVHHRH